MRVFQRDVQSYEGFTVDGLGKVSTRIPLAYEMATFHVREEEQLKVKAL